MRSPRFSRSFLNARMPYRVYGGLRFFERAEIKDALAYLHLVASRADDTSFRTRRQSAGPRHRAKDVDALRDTARCERHFAVEGGGHGRAGGLPQERRRPCKSF